MGLSRSPRGGESGSGYQESAARTAASPAFCNPSRGACTLAEAGTAASSSHTGCGVQLNGQPPPTADRSTRPDERQPTSLVHRGSRYANAKGATLAELAAPNIFRFSR